MHPGADASCARSCSERSRRRSRCRSPAAARAPPVHFTQRLLFPGLRPGRAADRHMSLPPRAALLAADGTPLAQGPTATSPIPDVAQQIVGASDRSRRARRSTYAALGYPPDAKVGLDGLERVFQTPLAGLARWRAARRAARCLHTAARRRGHDVTTTIEPKLERAAIAALGRQVCRDRGYGSAHRRGARARRASRSPALQPPGSTMKIITSTRALAAGIVKLGDTFPSWPRRDRRLHAPERQRRGVRRHVPELVRRVVQLRVRAARRKARRGSGWSRWPSDSASTRP